jgi:16S rRNA (cytosine967-C5)-methyltransferase
MAISPSRRIAFDILRRVTCEGAYASELLYTRLGPRISRADAALCTELTLGVLRWQGLLDFLIASHLQSQNARRDSKRTVEHLDIEVLLALRLGLYQLRFLGRVPAHAAVGESVELVKCGPKRSAAGLVNAVLRHAAPDAKVSGAELERLLPESLSASARAAILYSHPEWLATRWFAAFGERRAIDLMAANNRQPLLSCAVLDARCVEIVAESLQETPAERRADGAASELSSWRSVNSAATKSAARPGHWLRSALTLGGGNPATLAAFQSGEISLQDEASQMVAHLADARPGHRVLDVCAAPGGKATLLARAVAPNGSVIAGDLHEHRLRSMQEQLNRTGTRNVYLAALDATRPLPFPDPEIAERSFDRILVDAPCTGTGTLARNPEIRWRLKPGDLAGAHCRQVKMLVHALALLPAGGRLVYATCSLEPEENEQVLRDALTAPEADPASLHFVSGRAALEAHLRPGVSAEALFEGSGHDGCFRTFPPETHTDGFFAAVIEREFSP